MKKLNQIKKMSRFFILLIFFTFSCKSKEIVISDINLNTCPNNPDSLYERGEVLSVFASVLNEKSEFFRFGITKQLSGKGFQIYDLVDTSNVQSNSKDCIFFYNHHVYHFVSILLADSYSNIAYLDDGKIKIFKSINCNGDKIEDVIAYLEIKLANASNKNEIINRVINYRNYGRYIKTDDYDYIRDCDEHWSK